MQNNTHKPILGREGEVHMILGKDYYELLIEILRAEGYPAGKSTFCRSVLWEKLKAKKEELITKGFVFEGNRIVKSPS